MPGPGRLRCAQTAGPRALRPAPRPHKDADAPLGRVCLVLRAVGRQALGADCLGPPAFLRPLPAPGATLLRADAPLSCAVVARLLPVTSFVGDRQQRTIIIYVGRRDSPSASLRTRHVSLVRALALETACADSRAPVSLSLRSSPSVRALFPEPRSKDATRDHRRVVLIGQGQGGRLSMRATVSTFRLFPRFRRRVPIAAL